MLQLNFDNFQDTLEKSFDSDSSPSDMFEYLTGNSTSVNGKDKLNCIHDL